MSADLDKILLTRYYVLQLGQICTNPWCDCTFLTKTGRRFLATPFPRSEFWAALHASTIAAASHHDERIGSAGTVHLFRLGQELEMRLRDSVLRDGWTPDAADATELPDIIHFLKHSGGDEFDKTTEGPTRVSGIKRFTSLKSLDQIAAYYAHAFETDTQILPYGSDK